MEDLTHLKYDFGKNQLICKEIQEGIYFWKDKLQISLKFLSHKILMNKHIFDSVTTKETSYPCRSYFQLTLKQLNHEWSTGNMSLKDKG